MIFACERQGFRTAGGDEHLKARTAGEIRQHSPIVRIIFDDEENGVVGRKIAPIIH